MIIPVTVLALAWFIVMNHVYVRRVRAGKTEGLSHTFFRETTQFLYRFLVVGAAFSTLAVLLMGLNNDHTRLSSLVRLQRGVDGAERALRTVGLTPASTLVLLIVVYLLVLLVRQNQIRLSGRAADVRSRVDRVLPVVAVLTFVVFFTSRIGDTSLDPTSRIREIREGYAAYRTELRRELAVRVADRGTAQIHATSPDLRAIDDLRDSLWASRDAVLAAYAAAPVQAGQPIRVARVDTVRAIWTDAERHFIRRLDAVDSPGNLPRQLDTPEEEVPRSLSVQRTRDLREAVARAREEREQKRQSRAIVLGDAINRIGGAAITMYLAGVSEATIEAELRELVADFAQLDPTLPYLPRLFLDATESRLRARFDDQLSVMLRRAVESGLEFAAALDSAARRVGAELQTPSLDASIWVTLERRIRAAIDDARSRARAIEAARRAATRPPPRRVAVVDTTPTPAATAQRVDTLWNELVGLWLADDGLGESFTVAVGENQALREEAARVLGRTADSVTTLTLSPSADALRALSENYSSYVRGLDAERAERELEELVQAAQAEASAVRRVQLITTRALHRVPRALTTRLGVQ